MADVEKQVCECPTCGHKHVTSPRKIHVTKDMVRGLVQVYSFCKGKGDYHFTRKEVKPLFAGETLTATFGNWIYFGGILFKPEGKRGYWGINMERATAFLKGDLLIPEYVVKDPVTKDVTQSMGRVNVHNVKGVYELLDENGDFNVEYVS